MICDICQTKDRGYTVYFSEETIPQELFNYFEDRREDTWKKINNRMIWVIEPVFFDFIDYAEAHLVSDFIFAIISDVLDPLKQLNEMKKISDFKLERESSWIDTLIKQQSIVTHYQPIVSFENQNVKIIGHELLSRGINPQGDIIPPFKLFEAARIRNRVFALDRACRMQSVKNANVVGDKLIFINFIPTAIYVPEHCLSTTFSLIKKMNIKPEQVVFEVVETDEVTDIEHLKSILNYYRSHGFKYALDDVGVGFNDIETLMKMDPDVVKLAIEYTNGVCHDAEKQKVAKKVMMIAHDVGAMALAEGVEREEDFNFLIKMGYDLFQGYYFSKPTPQPLQSIVVNESLHLEQK